MNGVKTMLIAAAAVFVVGTLIAEADAQQLAGTYRVREGDETVYLNYIGRDSANTNVQIYSLSCNGVFTSSTGTLRFLPSNPFNPGGGGSISVRVTPTRNPLNLALQGSGSGSKGFGRTLTIFGLMLDGQARTLHFD